MWGAWPRRYVFLLGVGLFIRFVGPYLVITLVLATSAFYLLKGCLLP